MPLNPRAGRLRTLLVAARGRLAGALRVLKVRFARKPAGATAPKQAGPPKPSPARDKKGPANAATAPFRPGGGRGAKGLRTAAAFGKASWRALGRAYSGATRVGGAGAKVSGGYFASRGRLIGRIFASVVIALTTAALAVVIFGAKALGAVIRSLFRLGRRRPWATVALALLAAGAEGIVVAGARRGNWNLTRDLDLWSLPQNNPRVQAKASAASLAPLAFDYFRNPTAMVSDLGAPEEAMIARSGAVRTHAGLYRFRLGNARELVDVRLKRLRDGWLPAVEFETAVAGEPIRAKFSIFAETAESMPAVPYRYLASSLKQDIRVRRVPNLVVFVSIELTNLSDEAATTQVGFDALLGGEYGLAMQTGSHTDQYVYYAPSGEMYEIGRSRRDFGDSRDTLIVSSRPLTLWRDLEGAGARVRLNPRASTRVDFAIPYFPPQGEDGRRLLELDAQAALKRLEARWRGRAERWTWIDLPEAKPWETYRAAMKDILSGGIDVYGGHAIPTRSPFQYDEFYMRDAAATVEALDMFGESAIAEEVLRTFLDSQTPEGQFASQPGQSDGHGHALYALGQHARLAPGDGSFAREALPRVKRGMDWLRGVREKSAEGAPGLLPASGTSENERVESGHLTGQNFWALAGMRGAADVAEAAGRPEFAVQWRADAEQFATAIDEALAKTLAQTDDVIPPTFEGMRALNIVEQGRRVRGRFGERWGLDWGNLEAAYPTGALAPGNAALDQSMPQWDRLSAESLFPYPIDGRLSILHHYLTFSLTQTHLLRGERDKVLEQFYEGYLLHTTSTHEGAETIDAQRRDFFAEENLSPNFAFSAKYLILLRNMLLYEDAAREQLHLLAGANPEWLREGTPLKVLNAPTEFGLVSFGFERSPWGATLRFHADWRRAPQWIVVDLPASFKNALATDEKGHELRKSDSGAILAPSTAREIRMVWTPEDASARTYSYEKAVKEYVKKLPPVLRLEGDPAVE